MFASKAEQRRNEAQKKQKIVDMFNQLCSCKHRSDEHIAGDGQCFLCNCGSFKPIEELNFIERN